MGEINKIVSYWYDCIKNEDVLEQDISINVRTKAILYPFEKDPFIFNRKSHRIVTDKKNIIDFYEKSKVKKHELYYGYPILFYYDPRTQEHNVTPLFITKLSVVLAEDELTIEKEEVNPTCGINAFNKLGLKTEEIAEINQKIECVFNKGIQLSPIEMIGEVLAIIKDETSINIVEDINPAKLSSDIKLTKANNYGLYNKSLIFASEDNLYNVHLLQDLLGLKTKADLETTALGYLQRKNNSTPGNSFFPVLAYPSNEYQIAAMKDIFTNDISIITGPPGTGKSQFITNLIINLFLHNKKILLVSHTGEAVDVVNKKLNADFKNIIIRTGKKELRQEIKGKFNELIIESNRSKPKHITKDYIKTLWDNILEYKRALLEREQSETDFSNTYHLISTLIQQKKVKKNLFKKLKLLIQLFRLHISQYFLYQKLQKDLTNIEYERKIHELETDYFSACHDYVNNTYLANIKSHPTNVGKVNKLINEIHSRRRDEELDIGELDLNAALSILNVWSCTLKSLRASFPLNPNIFDYVIFDEASQIDLPSAAPALYRAKKAIIVGDPMQLTHIASITKDMDKMLAKQHGLSSNKNLYPHIIRYSDTSLFRSVENSLKQQPILLSNHYRSEDEIISLCNSVFYEGKLKIMTTLDYSKYPTDLEKGLHWHDIKGTVVKHPAGSRINKTEADSICLLLKTIIEKSKDTKLTIGIVTPYSKQSAEIINSIQANIPQAAIEKHDIKVLTAHKFQGSERDIMIFSLVLASKGDGNSDNWYNFYPQILNVALSRARYLLYIVGDMNFCRSREGILKKLIDNYDDLKKETDIEKLIFAARFDTPTEKLFYQKLKETDFEKHGYKLIPKLVVKRYTLDFALVGPKKICIEIDGAQHEIIEGMPVLEDVERDAFLTKEGWMIIRISNYIILKKTEQVIAEITSIITPQKDIMRKS